MIDFPLLARRACSRVTRAPQTLLRVAAVLVVVGVVASPRLAQAKHHLHPSSFEVIKAVNETARTVTVGHEHGKDHSEKALKVSDFTEITVDGQKATLHDLHAGMMVQVDLEADDVASTLDATHVNKK